MEEQNKKDTKCCGKPGCALAIVGLVVCSIALVGFMLPSFGNLSTLESPLYPYNNLVLKLGTNIVDGGSVHFFSASLYQAMIAMHIISCIIVTVCLVFWCVFMCINGPAVKLVKIVIVILSIVGFVTFGIAASIMTYLFVKHQVKMDGSMYSDDNPTGSYNRPPPNWIDDDDDDYGGSGFRPPPLPAPPPDPSGPPSSPSLPDWIDNNFDDDDDDDDDNHFPSIPDFPDIPDFPNFPDFPDHFQRSRRIVSRQIARNDLDEKTIKFLNEVYPALMWCGVILLVVALAISLVLAICVKGQSRKSRSSQEQNQQLPYPTQQPHPGMPPPGQGYNYGPESGQQGYYPAPYPQQHQQYPGQEHNADPNQYPQNQSQNTNPQGALAGQSQSEDESSIDQTRASQNPKLYRVPSKSEEKETRDDKEARKESKLDTKRNTLDSGGSGLYGPVTPPPPAELNDPSDDIDQKKS